MVISCKEAPQTDSSENYTMIEPTRRFFSDSIISEVNHDSLPAFPAEVIVVNAGNPKTLP